MHKDKPGTVSLRVVHAAGVTHDKNGERKLADSIEPKYRMMLNLIYFQGFSVEEISTRFSLPVAEVKLRLALAVRQLRAGCRPE
ncbi:RNA polymerase sigma factor [Daejeonella lutea]|uniref:RNA polymerase sigma factor n=1 Tax=Daejeonella lutea TaxID=572036 RepID=UPI0009A78B70|nr:sigma factor-like helix-turn-helix DNA-binding protein [Daejeonella lutea]